MSDSPLLSPADTADAVVIGGGPAGSTVSALIAERGFRVRLYERERFPRFHVGESLIPETYWTLERLGMIEKLKNSPFVKKYSVQFVGSDGRYSTPFYFHENKPGDSSQTWQVERSEFDQIMLDNAREKGVEVNEGVRVRDVLFEQDRAVGVRIQRSDGSRREIRARVIIDAGGQSGLLMNRFGLRVWDPVLNKGAIWTYWRGAQRDSGLDAGATMVLQTADRQGWFWSIPMHRDTTSIGVVKPFDDLFRKGRSHEEAYQEEVEGCPALKDRISGAERVAEYLATRDFSYRSKQVAGHGWVLVGDAYAFLDPLYSSGILLALRSGEMAADAIVEGLLKQDLSPAQLGSWGPAFQRGLDRMRRLVCEYYDGFSFGRFIREFPHLKGTLTDLLIGDLFTDRVDCIWEPMESLYPAGKTTPPSWNAEQVQSRLEAGRRPDADEAGS